MRPVELASSLHTDQFGDVDFYFKRLFTILIGVPMPLTWVDQNGIVFSVRCRCRVHGHRVRSHGDGFGRKEQCWLCRIGGIFLTVSILVRCVGSNTPRCPDTWAWFGW